MKYLHLCCAGVGLMLWATTAARGDAAPLALGAKVEASGSLRDVRGNSRPLTGFKDYRAVVLAFLGTECPVSNLYVPGLLELEKQFRAQNVLFLAIYPNEHEDLDQIAVHAYDRDLPFPALKDVGHKLADALGIKRVPTVAVLDGAMELKYRGRVDDRYGVAFRRPAATRRDLGEAIGEVLAGKQVSVAETEADGCLLSTLQPSPAGPEVTYAKHVSRILQQRCQRCHRPGEAAFSLLTYEDAVRHARMIKEVTTQRRMPPWHADPRHGKFGNERRLEAAEIDVLARWVDAGQARGNDSDAPPPVDWPSGWKFGKPDVVFSMPKEFEVPADGVLPYQHFIVETGFDEDRWVRTAEARPGAPGVVHHVVVYLLKQGQTKPFAADGNMSVLVGWAPGDLGLSLPADTALRIPKGARLLFEMHYTPNGTAMKDLSSVGIVFAKEPPRFELMMNSFANESIKLPPNDPHYRAEAVFRIRADARLLSLTPHMHWRGKDYRYELIYPDGRREVLLSVPRWDFNWQNVYQFQEPVKLPKGARLHAVAHWDNSRNNPYNPDPSKTVKFGLQTWEEMMVGWVAYVWERPETAAELAKQTVNQADLMFDRFDRNGDDFITAEEIPEQLRPLIFLSGIRAERVDRAEFVRLFNEMRQRLQKEKK
jgi:thiol-disulfide isomerase/thioredoxin